MRLLSEFDIRFELPAPTAMVALLHLYPTLAGHLLAPEILRVERMEGNGASAIGTEDYRDAFGNQCTRFMAPMGALRLSGHSLVDVPAEADVAWADAGQAPVEQLPAETLQFLLASRYCQVDQMIAIASDLFGWTAPGWARATAIRDWVHDHVAFNYKAARATKTALDVYTERVGVCRDFQHLAITLTRAMNIPARYATGYLGDVRHPYGGPGDFSAWYEVYLGGEWRTMDARHNSPRFGRLLMAVGRDATDVAITTSFGVANLTHFSVESNEVDETGAKVILPSPLAETQPGEATVETAVSRAEAATAVAAGEGEKSI